MAKDIISKYCLREVVVTMRRWHVPESKQGGGVFLEKAPKVTLFISRATWPVENSLLWQCVFPTPSSSFHHFTVSSLCNITEKHLRLLRTSIKNHQI